MGARGLIVDDHAGFRKHEGLESRDCGAGRVHDGVGGADAASGTGLRGLFDRVAALGGKLDVDSRPGHGTTGRAAIPCD